MNGLNTIAMIAAATILFLIFTGFVLARLYKRATRETSLVRTGAGGRKVVVDGGCMVLPMFHALTAINMTTLRLEVQRNGDASLITKDRMRVDVGVEFYVRVQSNEEGIARAAQTLGGRTFEIAALREMIEGKLVDGLRSVAAQMTMDELHEKRSDFVQQVQQAVSEDLIKNGLELESVSLTALDQTPFAALDENNAFNAQGMRQLAEVVSREKKTRARIEAETEVEIAKARQQAAVQTYEVEKEQEAARVQQAVALSAMKSDEVAAAAEQEEKSKKAAERARIEREQATRAAEIEKEKAIEIAEKTRQIEISKKSEEESVARAAADLARAEAAVAEEAVVTARRTAEAERTKRVTLIAAEEAAEKEAVQIRVSAAAEKAAASDQAEAKLALAQADADAVTIAAKAELDRATAEAEGREKLVAAENGMSPEIIQMKLILARLEALPAIIAEMVKPAEKIDSIRIQQVSGLSNGGGKDGVPEGRTTGAIDQVFDSVQGMMIQAPLLKAIGDAAGVTLGDGVRGALDGDAAALLGLNGSKPKAEPAPTPDAV